MKKINVIIAGTFLVLFAFKAHSQVGINTTGSSPHPSAMLDVSSSNKGLLVPRVTLTALGDNINPIDNPAHGLLVYNMNSALDEGFYVWTGYQWSALASMDYVNNSVNGMDESAFGELYEFHEMGGYTTVNLTSNGSWHGWGSAVTGDTSMVFTDVASSVKRINIEVGGHYLVSFTGSIQAQSGNVVFDVALFQNDLVQNDLRARTECHSAQATESCSFSGIINLVPGDYIDIRFSGNQNKQIRIESANLSISKID